MIKLNLVCEKFIGTANGVYTAFLETIDALEKRPDVDLVVNGRGYNYDVLHAQSIGVLYFWKSLFCKHKLVVTAHVVPDSFIGSLIFSRLWQPLARLYLKWAYSRARLVIACSPVVKQELENIGVKNEIRVLCNSVDREKFKQDPQLRSQYREKLGLAADDFVILGVGQIQPRKGIADFIDTAKKCPDIKFVWVGGRPFGRLTADYDQLTKMVDDAPPNLIFTDIVPFEEIPGYYAASDVYFLPSFQENFAYATIEAASVKLPLLLRDNVEYPDTLFTHYLKGKTADDFAEISRKLASDPDFLAKWQNESDQLASKFESTVFAETLVSFYTLVKNGGVSN